VVRGGGAGATGAPAACGWAFHAEDRFDRAALLALLQQLRPRVARVKGVFRVGAAEWALPSLRLGGGDPPREEAALAPVCYRGESVAEVILHQGTCGARRQSSGVGVGGAGGGQSGEGAPGGGLGEARGEQTDAAVAAAGAGDWAPLEALLLETLTSSQGGR
jgi:hypothetical protein